MWDALWIQSVERTVFVEGAMGIVWDCGDVSFRLGRSAGRRSGMHGYVMGVGQNVMMPRAWVGGSSRLRFWTRLERAVECDTPMRLVGEVVFSRRIEAPGIACGGIAGAKNDDEATLLAFGADLGLGLDVDVPRGK